jgi:hypothetical protein
MKRLLFIFFLFSTTIALGQSYADTGQLNRYIRDTIRDRRPDKITANDLQKAFLGTTTLMTKRADSLFGDIQSRVNLFSPAVPVDTVTMYSMPITNTTAANGWVGGSSYATNAVESAVAGGLQITNSYTGAYTTTNMVRSWWESSLDDIEVTFTFKIVTMGSTNPLVGVMMWGATDLFAISQYDAYNLNTGSLNSAWYNSAYQQRANTGITFSNGDTVTVNYRRFFHFMYHTITNQTKKKTFTYYINGSAVGGTSWVGDVYPGLYMQDGTYLLQSFKIIGHGYASDMAILGSSVIQTQSAVVDYDSSSIRRAQALSGVRMVGAAKAANKLQDCLQALPEIRAIKPRYCAIEAGHNNLVAGETVSTWGPIYHQIVDSLLAYGITPVCIRPVPSTWVNIPTLNDFIDSAFGHNPNVRIINLYNTTPLYNTGFPSNKDPQYYIDNAHLNAAGAKLQGIGLAGEVRNIKLNRQYEWTTITADANYTLPFSVYKVKLATALTAGRTLTLPPAASNKLAVFTIANFNTGSFFWVVNQSLRRADGTQITQLLNGKSYLISVVDGEYFIEKE